MDITIKTKFNPGDTALRFNPGTNKLEEFHIRSAYIYIGADGIPSIGYFTEDSYQNTLEKDLFKSKEEFINKL